MLEAEIIGFWLAYRSVHTGIIFTPRKPHPLLSQVTSSLNVVLIPSLNLHPQPHHHALAGRLGNVLAPPLSSILFVTEYHSNNHSSEITYSLSVLWEDKIPKPGPYLIHRYVPCIRSGTQQGLNKCLGKECLGMGHSPSSFCIDLNTYQVKPDSLCPQRSKICGRPAQRQGPSIGGWVVRVGLIRVPGARFGVANGRRSHRLFLLPALSLYI